MIFFEEYLDDINMEAELCFFNGKLRLITLFFNDRYITKKPTVSYYDENWNIFNVTHPKYTVKTDPVKKPPFMDKLIAFGERYAKKMDHVRIDFFITPKKEIYFCEFTFTTGGGYKRDHLDQMVGRYWDFPDAEDSLDNPYSIIG